MTTSVTAACFSMEHETCSGFVGLSSCECHCHLADEEADARLENLWEEQDR